MAGINFIGLFIAFAALILSLSVHEAAHAWSADRLGDPTARLLGRVSLNPAVHVDPIGTILFPLIAMVSGVPVLGWAKPVPVNTFNLRRNWKEKYMLIAAAGPASNLILATIAAILLRVTTERGVASQALFFMVQLNVGLAVFNMIPVPPLDGGNVLAGLLRGSAAEAFNRLRPWGFVLLYALMFSGILFAVMTPVMNFILALLL